MRLPSPSFRSFTPNISPKLQKVFDALLSGRFVPREIASSIINPLRSFDNYLVTYDFDDYILVAFPCRPLFSFIPRTLQSSGPR